MMPPSVKFSTRSIGGKEPVSSACLTAGKESREMGGSRQGKCWKAPHTTGGGGEGCLPGRRGTKRGAVAVLLATQSGSPRRSPRPARGPAAGPPPPLPPSRASCHGDQTCLCALRCCDFLILCRSGAHTHTHSHTHTPPQPAPSSKSLQVFPELRGRARALLPTQWTRRAQNTHTLTRTLAPAPRAPRRKPPELAALSYPSTPPTPLSCPAKLFFPA